VDNFGRILRNIIHKASSLDVPTLLKMKMAKRKKEQETQVFFSITPMV